MNDRERSPERPQPPFSSAKPIGSGGRRAPTVERLRGCGHLRCLVDAYFWPSRVWKRIARTLERERGAG